MKYIVWVKENGKWVEQGDGPLTEKQATRIAREIRTDCRVQTRVLPVGAIPAVREGRVITIPALPGDPFTR